MTVVATVKALATKREPCKCGGDEMSPHDVEFEVTSSKGSRRVCSRELVWACEDLTTKE